MLDADFHRNREFCKRIQPNNAVIFLSLVNSKLTAQIPHTNAIFSSQSQVLVDIYLFKVNNSKTRGMCEVTSAQT